MRKKWTKITDGFPPIGVPLIVTVKDGLQGKPNTLRYPVYYEKAKELLKKEDTKTVSRGRSSNSSCMIVFCSFEQISTLVNAAQKHGFVNYIPLVFCKNYSPQVLKANMRIVGATEYALVF